MRRLPVLQTASEQDEERPAWHWTLIGALLIFAIWIPLAMLGTLVLQKTMVRWFGDAPPEEIARLLASGSPTDRARVWLVISGLHIVTLSSAALGGGAMVGRFGGKAGPREAALGGVLVALAGWSLTAIRTELFPSLPLIFGLGLLAGGFAWIGGKLGFRRRLAGILRPPPPPPSRPAGAP
jgi:hypothetical protein